MTNDTLTIDTHPRSATIGEIAKAIADAVVLDLSIVGISMDPQIVAAVKEWQQSRSEAMMHGATTKEGDRFKAACEALAAVVCK